MINRRQFLRISTAIATGMALASCGWTLADVRSTPSSITTDELFIYTWAGYVDDYFIKLFEQEFGFVAIADVFDSNEAMLARIQASGGGSYSIIYPSDYMVEQMRELNLLTELDPTRILGLDELFPNFKNPSYDPENKFSIPITWGTTGLIYNRKKLPSLPEDWDYLWQNKELLSKRFTLLNDVREVMGAILRSLGYSYNSINPQEIEQAYEKLLQIKDNIASFTSDAWRNQILSGDLLIAMCYSSDANEIIEEDTSGDLEYLVPSSGSSLWTDTMVIPITVTNIDAAYAWINFMLQPNISAEICQRLSFATPNKTAWEMLPSELKNNVSIFPPESIINNCERLATIPVEINDLYDRYWTQLTSG